MDVREVALALPEVTEETSFGTPSFKVKGKFMARLKEDFETLVVRMPFAEREGCLAEEPELFYITDHYLNWPGVLVRLEVASVERLRELIEGAWRMQAPKRLLAAWDAQNSPPVE